MGDNLVLLWFHPYFFQHNDKEGRERKGRGGGGGGMDKGKTSRVEKQENNIRR